LHGLPWEKVARGRIDYLMPSAPAELCHYSNKRQISEFLESRLKGFGGPEQYIDESPSIFDGNLMALTNVGISISEI
jgi:hypothetical protein